MGQKIIYLVRHGHYDSSPPAADQLEGSDQLGGSLTEFRQRAVRSGGLRQLSIDRTHSSSMRRAAKPASVIATEFPEVPL